MTTYPEGSTRTYLLIYLVNMVLLGATCAIFIEVPMHWGNTAVELGIATAQVFLTVVFYMHLRQSTPMVRLASIVGLVWLTILIALTINDYLTRA